jgi:hypothetical protein
VFVIALGFAVKLKGSDRDMALRCARRVESLIVESLPNPFSVAIRGEETCFWRRDKPIGSSDVSLGKCQSVLRPN